MANPIALLGRSSDFRQPSQDASKPAGVATEASQAKAGPEFSELVDGQIAELPIDPEQIRDETVNFLTPQPETQANTPALETQFQPQFIKTDGSDPQPAHSQDTTVQAAATELQPEIAHVPPPQQAEVDSPSVDHEQMPLTDKSPDIQTAKLNGLPAQVQASPEPNTTIGSRVVEPQISTPQRELQRGTQTEPPKIVSTEVPRSVSPDINPAQARSSASPGGQIEAPSAPQTTQQANLEVSAAQPPAAQGPDKAPQFVSATQQVQEEPIPASTDEIKTPRTGRQPKSVTPTLQANQTTTPMHPLLTPGLAAQPDPSLMLSEPVPQDSLQSMGPLRDAVETGPNVESKSSSLNPARISQQIVRQISKAGDIRNGAELELRLDPPELGRIRISFSGLDGNLTAVVSAERAEVEALMRRNIEELQKALAEAGFENANLSFESHDQNQTPESDQAQPMVFGSEYSDALPDISMPQPARPRGDGNLDIRL